MTEPIPPSGQDESGGFSPDNPPSAETMASRMYAVHATHVLPQDSWLRPGAKAGHDGVLHDKEPPSFRPTLHFALGGMVQPHEGGSWETAPYAALAPLGSLTEQLASLYPHDTTVVGDVALHSAGVALLVPEGTDTSHLPPGVNVKSYPPERSLRQATAEHIAEQGGWNLTTRAGGAGLDASAHLGDTQINDIRFFENYLEANPHVSYGPHTQSVKGEAYRYGMVDQVVGRSIHALKDEGPFYDPTLVLFEAKLARHHLEKLDESVHAGPLPPHALETFTSKKEAAQSWLDVLDCDERLRKEYGVTIAKAPDEVFRKIEELHDDKELLWEYVSSHRQELDVARPETPHAGHYVMLGQYCSAMPRAELDELKQSNPEMFSQLDMPQLDMIYALTRLAESGEHRDGENLHQLLADSVRQIPEETRQAYEVLIPQIMETYLYKDSLRLPATLDVFSQPEMSKLLGLNESEQPMKTLGDLIRRHPSTKALAPIEFTPAEQQKIDQFIAKGELKPLPKWDIDEIATFAEAKEHAKEIRSELGFYRYYLDNEEA